MKIHRIDPNTIILEYKVHNYQFFKQIHYNPIHKQYYTISEYSKRFDSFVLSLSYNSALLLANCIIPESKNHIETYTLMHVKTRKRKQWILSHINPNVRVPITLKQGKSLLHYFTNNILSFMNRIGMYIRERI